MLFCFVLTSFLFRSKLSTESVFRYIANYGLGKKLYSQKRKSAIAYRFRDGFATFEQAIAISKGKYGVFVSQVSSVLA